MIWNGSVQSSSLPHVPPKTPCMSWVEVLRVDAGYPVPPKNPPKWQPSWPIQEVSGWCNWNCGNTSHQTTLLSDFPKTNWKWLPSNGSQWCHGIPIFKDSDSHMLQFTTGTIRWWFQPSSETYLQKIMWKIWKLTCSPIRGRYRRPAWKQKKSTMDHMHHITYCLKLKLPRHSDTDFLQNASNQFCFSFLVIEHSAARTQKIVGKQVYNMCKEKFVFALEENCMERM